MANYTPINNFAAKDSLPPGDPNKKAKGTDIQAELNGIAAAIQTKANVDVPQTFTQNVTFNENVSITNDLSVTGQSSLGTVLASLVDCGTY